MIRCVDKNNEWKKWVKVGKCVNLCHIMQLIGEFQINLDGKGRFLMPAGIKKQVADGELRDVIINRGFEKCLVIYPASTWASLQKKLNTLNDFNPKAREFKRLFLNGATNVELDKAGRVLLSKALTEYADISKEMVLIGLGNKMELWSSEAYQEYMSDNVSGFSDLASEVAGTDFFNVE